MGDVRRGAGGAVGGTEGSHEVASYGVQNIQKRFRNRFHSSREGVKPPKFFFGTVLHTSEGVKPRELRKG